MKTNFWNPVFFALFLISIRHTHKAINNFFFSISIQFIVLSSVRKVECIVHVHIVTFIDNITKRCVFLLFYFLLNIFLMAIEVLILMLLSTSLILCSIKQNICLVQCFPFFLLWIKIFVWMSENCSNCEFVVNISCQIDCFG